MADVPTTSGVPPAGGPDTSTLDKLRGSLRLPVVVAPMFLISSPQLVTAACKAGVIGSFPAPNARTLADLEAWLDAIVSLREADYACWAVNLLVHPSNTRLQEELNLIRRYQPPLVISALGSPRPIVDAIHSYGGTVFGDVTSPTMARKAIAAGADGLILVCAGAGGHTGQYSPFAFIREVRRFWRGPLVAAGAISDARSILAAQLLGADLVYMGTRFIATPESMASDDYRRMLIESGMEDIVRTSAVTGVEANFMRASLYQAGFNDAMLTRASKVDFSSERLGDVKAWKQIWGAGQGVSCVDKVCTVAQIVADLTAEYEALGGGRG
ncbi:MAG: nitronate monooxygenase [Proteobacteria bacterium]|nr:nitronate monooxygenase [Pseudomonadota bacterium]